MRAGRRGDAGGGAETAPSEIILSPAAEQRSGARGTLRPGFSRAGRMATVVVEATEPEPSGSIANPAASTSPSLSHRFLDSKFYLLVVVGETVTEEHLRRAIGNIELGKRSRGPQGRAPGDAPPRPHPGRDGHLVLSHAPHPRLCRPPLTLHLDSFSELISKLFYLRSRERIFSSPEG